MHEQNLGTPDNARFVRGATAGDWRAWERWVDPYSRLIWASTTRVHGAWGYLKDAGIERDLWDSVADTIYSGTSEIQRVVVARILGL